MTSYRGATVCFLIGASLTASSGEAAVFQDAPFQQNAAGIPVHQRFLDSGASVVTTLDSRSCVVSQKIDIAASTYLTDTGEAVPFDEVVRSPATSVQAIAGTDGGVSFRIQMKYSLVPDQPIILTLGDDQIDLSGALERSTDSLWIIGDDAVALDAAFRSGMMAQITATSVDTAHVVIDDVPSPDLAALEACVTDLVPLDVAPVDLAPMDLTSLNLVPTDQVQQQISNDIRLAFHADPETTPLATLPELRACRMNDVPGTLYLAKLDEVDGFFSQTREVFVSFQDDGSLARAYIPGIFDGDFGQDRDSARLSRSADSNVPAASNSVKGCLGSAQVSICSISSEDGNHVLAPCRYMQMLAFDTDGGLTDDILADDGVTNSGVLDHGLLQIDNSLIASLDPFFRAPNLGGTTSNTSTQSSTGPTPSSATGGTSSASGGTPVGGGFFTPVTRNRSTDTDNRDNRDDTPIRFIDFDGAAGGDLGVDPVAAVPLPIPAYMLGFALLSLVGMRRFRKG